MFSTFVTGGCNWSNAQWLWSVYRTGIPLSTDVWFQQELLFYQKTKGNKDKVLNFGSYNFILLSAMIPASINGVNHDHNQLQRTLV